MPKKYQYRFIQESLSRSKEEIRDIQKNHLSSVILIMLYLVAVLCLIFQVHPQFIFLTPINLLLSLIIVLFAHSRWNAGVITALLICFVVGFSIEVIGVATGEIFGTYQYGEVLGYKYKETPYMIGVNWAMLVYCTAATVNELTNFARKHWSVFIIKSLLGALLLVSLDILIEPVAILYDFWSWGGDGTVPIQNYVAWFLISFFLLLVFNLLVKKLNNKPAFVLLILQFLFFFLLGIEVV